MTESELVLFSNLTDPGMMVPTRNSPVYSKTICTSVCLSFNEINTKEPLSVTPMLYIYALYCSLAHRLFKKS